MLFALCAMTARSATFHVAPGGGQVPPYATWSDVVALAGHGDTVLVSNGLYGIESQIHIGRGITVKSLNGPGPTIVRGNEARLGGGIAAYFQNRITGTKVTGNTAGQVGGVFLADPSRMAHSRVESNQALRGGGLCGFLGGAVFATAITNNAAASDPDVHLVTETGRATYFDAACTVAQGVGEGVAMNHNCLVASSDISRHGMHGINMRIDNHIRESVVSHNTSLPLTRVALPGGAEEQAFYRVELE